MECTLVGLIELRYGLKIKSPTICLRKLSAALTKLITSMVLSNNSMGDQLLGS
jgi:hypothetical protein